MLVLLCPRVPGTIQVFAVKVLQLRQCVPRSTAHAADSAAVTRACSAEPRCVCAQLKILACNISGGDLQGEILVNGSLVNPKDFRKQSAVVWQSDVLLATATVRTRLIAHARLRPSASTGARTKRTDKT